METEVTAAEGRTGFGNPWGRRLSGSGTVAPRIAPAQPGAQSRWLELGDHWLWKQDRFASLTLNFLAKTRQSA